jgi:carboxyl-terminal processing protease
VKQLGFLIFFPLIIYSQVQKNTCTSWSNLNAIIQQHHYKPKPVDDSLSVYVFNTFIDNLDEDHRILTAEEVTRLKVHELQIDDYLTQSNCSFLDDIFTIFNQAVARYKATIDDFKMEAFPLSHPETIVFSKKAAPFAKDEKELKNQFKKRILFTILKDIAETSKNKDSLVTHFDAIAKKAKEKIFEEYLCKHASIENTRDKFNSLFLATFCSYFDPHTTYFSADDKSSFFSVFSTDNLSFGINISKNENDEVVVDNVIPGSSASSSGKINIGDQLIKVKTKTEEFYVSCMYLHKIEQLFTTNEFKVADFTFKKKSGENYTVTLTKKLMKDYENTVYSYLIKKDQHNFGYIKIPSFYGAFEYGKTNLSDDVAKEVVKLKKDKISGLIIDVQNDGGGSLEEATKLSGAFVDYGALAIMNNRDNNKEILYDRSFGSIYTGPMVVLINGFSASASEFFANAMQDYNRAIIVGNTSYGKASMQNVLPLQSEDEEAEYIKITLQEFYRITGKSNQAIGVQPDVEIPTLFNNQFPKEKDVKTALPNSSIDSAKRFKPYNNNFIPVIQKSNARVLEHPSVQAITEMNKRIDQLLDYDLPPIQLNFDAVFEDVNRINRMWKDIEKLAETQYPLEVERNSADSKSQELDEFLKSSTTEKIKAIKSNIHIVEAVNILQDVLKQP